MYADFTYILNSCTYIIYIYVYIHTVYIYVFTLYIYTYSLHMHTSANFGFYSIVGANCWSKRYISEYQIPIRQTWSTSEREQLGLQLKVQREHWNHWSQPHILQTNNKATSCTRMYHRPICSSYRPVKANYQSRRAQRAKLLWVGITSLMQNYCSCSVVYCLFSIL